MLQMNRGDYDAVRLLMDAKALVPIETEKLPRSGWGKVFCGDGDVTPDAIPSFTEICARANGEKTCRHIIAIDGGPAAVAPNSPFHTLRYRGKDVLNYREYLFAKMEGLLRVKSVRVQNMGFVPHCACGMCQLHNLSIWDNLTCTLTCKDIARQEFGARFKHYKVFPLINFDGYPEAEKGKLQFLLLRRSEFEKEWGKRTSQRVEAA